MLSVIIISKNEQDRIKACLESVKWVDEIIVVDNGSEDNTLDIAKEYTNKIFKVNFDDFVSWRNFATEKASGEWLLFVDPDERVTDSLRAEIEAIIAYSDFAAYAVSRKNIIFGSEVKYGPFWPDWVIRLIKKSSFKGWIGRVHEYPEFDGKLGYSKNSLIHLTHRNIDQITLKSLEWSKIDANLRSESGHPKMSGWRFLRILLTETFKQGIIKKGFFNGSVGTIDSLMQVFSLIITYVRLWEMQQKKPLNEIYDKLDQDLINNNFKY